MSAGQNPGFLRWYEKHDLQPSHQNQFHSMKQLEMDRLRQDLGGLESAEDWDAEVCLFLYEMLDYRR